MKHNIFNLNVRTMVITALMSAIAFALMFIHFSIPIFPSFLKFDVADIPAMITAFTISPVAGVLVVLIKNVLHFILPSLSTPTGGVGELSNFLINGTFVLTAGIIYKYLKTKKGVLISVISALLVMCVTAAFVNYFIILPFYSNLMPMEKIISMSQKAVPFINNKMDIVLYGVVPFNLFKGIVISVITVLLYDKLTPLINGKYN